MMENRKIYKIGTIMFYIEKELHQKLFFINLNNELEYSFYEKESQKIKDTGWFFNIENYKFYQLL